jgi:hypothetical protein
MRRFAAAVALVAIVALPTALASSSSADLAFMAPRPCCTN